MGEVNKVVKIIADKLKLKPEDIDVNAELKIDHLDLMLVVMELEDIYGLAVTETDFASFTTVQKIIDYVNDKTKKSGQV